DAGWAVGERAVAERLIGEARLTAARAALSGGDIAAAADLAAAMFEGSPYDEAPLRLLMEAHTAAGRSALAIAAYGQLRERLSDELGVEPAPETEAIYLRILRQESLPGTGHGRIPTRRASESTMPVLPGRERELLAL